VANGEDGFSGAAAEGDTTLLSGVPFEVVDPGDDAPPEFFAWVCAVAAFVVAGSGLVTFFGALVSTGRGAVCVGSVGDTPADASVVGTVAGDVAGGEVVAGVVAGVVVGTVADDVAGGEVVAGVVVGAGALMLADSEAMS